MANLDSYMAPNEINRLRTLALGVGGIALLFWAGGTYLNPEQGLRSWLLGFIFWGGIGLGCLGVLMLQYLTGGAWGVVIRRIVEAGSRTLPMILLLFIPLAAGSIFVSPFHDEQNAVCRFKQDMLTAVHGQCRPVQQYDVEGRRKATD